MNGAMTAAVLGMPFDLAMSDELSRRQYWERAQEARAELAALHQDLDDTKLALLDMEGQYEAGLALIADLRAAEFISHERMVLASVRYNQAHGITDGSWPDLGVLLHWFMDEKSALQADNARLEAEKQNEFDIASGYYKRWQKAQADNARMREALDASLKVMTTRGRFHGLSDADPIAAIEKAKEALSVIGPRDTADEVRGMSSEALAALSTTAPDGRFVTLERLRQLERVVAFACVSENGMMLSRMKTAQLLECSLFDLDARLAALLQEENS
jgi:hypothetical protein